MMTSIQCHHSDSLPPMPSVQYPAYDTLPVMPSLPPISTLLPIPSMCLYMLLHQTTSIHSTHVHTHCTHLFTTLWYLPSLISSLDKLFQNWQLYTHSYISAAPSSDADVSRFHSLVDGRTPLQVTGHVSSLAWDWGLQLSTERWHCPTCTMTQCHSVVKW